jgi:hypothetical protein
MSKIVWSIEKYGRTWYKVVLGHSYRLFRLWRQRHVTLVNPKELPSGEPPEMYATIYHRGYQGYDPNKGKLLVSIQGFGIITAVLAEIFESLAAVPLRGEYVPTGGGRQVPLDVLLLGDDAERQVYRLAFWLARQANVLREPTPLSELHRVAMRIVAEVNHITLTGAL